MFARVPPRRNASRRLSVKDLVMPFPNASTTDTPLVLALDIGTSSTRAILYNGRGEELTGLKSQTTYSMNTTSDGGVEVEADRLIERVASNVDELLQKAGECANRIRWVAVSAFWHSLVGVGESGKAVTPVFSWNDTRSNPAAEVLRARLDEDEVHARTGCVLHASYLPAKILWLANTQPAVFRSARRWMSFGEYLSLCLFGETGCSVSMASATGLFNQNEIVWDSFVLGALPIDQHQLSPILDDHVAFSGLRSEFADRWPALRDAKWFPALGDGACSNIGMGCVSPQQIALMVGTSGAMRVLVRSDRLDVPQGLWCYRADRKRFLIGGALSNGGNLYAWMTRTLCLPGAEPLEAELASMGADDHGLTVLPFLSGERSTGWVADARATFTELSLATKPVEILRAALEAVAYRFAAIHERLIEAVPSARQVVASGAGLLQSKVWTQIIADVLGVPVSASAVDEASCRGAALFVLDQAGAIESIDTLAPASGEVFQVNSESHAKYLIARQRHEQLYQQLVGSGQRRCAREEAFALAH